MKAISIIIFYFSCVSVSVSGNIQCRDENNNPVDWYVLYKFPKIPDTSPPYVDEGKGYMYMTSASANKGWQVSSKPINSSSSLLAQSIHFVRNNTKNIFWAVYNDQGTKQCEDCGHTKGIIGGDKKGGIWLVHSIPHFLNGTYPETGVRYGQSAVCVSLDKDTLNSIGDLLAYNTPNFQNLNTPYDFKGIYPKIMAAINRVSVSVPWKLAKELTTTSGTKIIAFAKSKQFGKDIYEWVASHFQVDIMTETWQNEEGALSNNCNLIYKVMNIQSLSIPIIKRSFSSHKDHSKLAISVAHSVVCIGDINRAVPQETRGGGTICFNNTRLWNAYVNLIQNVEQCPKVTLI